MNKGSFDSAQFTEGHSEAILARIAAQLAKHERSRHGSLLDRSGETKDVVPVRANYFQIDSRARHGCQRLVSDLAVWKVKLRVAQIADAWSKAEAERMHEGEDMVGEAGRVGVMLLDPQVGFMVKQSVEDVGGVSHADVDDFGAERRVLI